MNTRTNRTPSRMPTVMRDPDGRGKTRPVPIPDFGAKALGTHPQQTMRVLGLIRAGTSWRKLIEIGRYQGSWTEADLRRIVHDNELTVHDMPTTTTTTPAHVLTLDPRGMAISAGICKGWTNIEIAAATGLPASTVSSAARRIIARARTRDRMAYVVAVLTGRVMPCAQDEHDA